MRQIPVLAQGRAAEVFDRAYGLAGIRRAGVDLDAHAGFRYLQAFYELGFYELGVKPPPMRRRPTSSSGCSGGRANNGSDSPPDVICCNRARGASRALFVIDAAIWSVGESQENRLAYLVRAICLVRFPSSAPSPAATGGSR